MFVAASLAKQAYRLLRMTQEVQARWSSLPPDQKDQLSEKLKDVRSAADDVQYSMTFGVRKFARTAQLESRHRSYEQAVAWDERLKKAREDHSWAFTQAVLDAMRGGADTPAKIVAVVGDTGPGDARDSALTALRTLQGQGLIRKTVFGERWRWRSAKKTPETTARWVNKLIAHLESTGVAPVHELLPKLPAGDNDAKIRYVADAVRASLIDWVAPEIYGLPREQLADFEIEIPEDADDDSMPREKRPLKEAVADLAAALTEMKAALDSPGPVVALPAGPSDYNGNVPQAASPIATKRCRSCGEGCPPDAAFCPHCGTDLAPRRCPQCAEESDTEGHFCPYCGSRYESD